MMKALKLMDKGNIFLEFGQDGEKITKIFK